MISNAENWVPMGYIKGAVGIRGWVKVKADTEYSDSLLAYSQWQLRKDREILKVTLEAGKLVSGELQVKFASVHDRDAAALLRGYTIEIARAEFDSTEEDEYYWADLVGMRVINREGETLGIVANLMETGAHDVLVVRGEAGEKLIPFVEQFVDAVDEQQKIITVDWGLDY